MLSLIQSPLEAAGTNSATFEFLMDRGFTGTLGNLAYIRKIDPWDQLPQADVIRAVCISNPSTDILDTLTRLVNITLEIPS